MVAATWLGALELVAILLIASIKTPDFCAAQRIVFDFSPGNYECTPDQIKPHPK